jgi:hypothetical protein
VDLTVVEVVGEAAPWTRQWLRWSWRWRRGLNDVKEGTGKFGSLMASK